jgi:two-component system, cell cycle sensor histidine kinase and response regulator CckA
MSGRPRQDQDDRKQLDHYTLPTMPSPNTVTSSPDPTALDIKSILLVDDDEELADALKGLLESHNFVVTTARNGVEGIKEVMALDFDAIVCDMMMPHMAGDMFYLAVQRAKPNLCRRFVFITAHGSDAKVEQFITKVDGLVLFKPVQIEELIGMISLAFKRGQSS